MIPAAGHAIPATAPAGAFPVPAGAAAPGPAIPAPGPAIPAPGPAIPAPGPAIPAPDLVPWARQPSKPVKRATTRARRVVDNLPAWEPLPPGEILVHRPRSA